MFQILFFAYWENIGSTKHRHLTRLAAVIFASSHVRLHCPSSWSIFRLQVFFGRPLLYKPWGFNSSAILVILSAFFPMVWPIQFPSLPLICFSKSCSLIRFQRSMLLMVLGQNVQHMNLRHLLMNTCSFSWLCLKLVRFRFRASE